MALFPIMQPRDNIADLRRADLPCIVIGIPWAMIQPHERQAHANHSQTLKRLAERGGLSASEAMAVLEDRPWRRMEQIEAHHSLMRALVAFDPA